MNVSTAKIAAAILIILLTLGGCAGQSPAVSPTPSIASTPQPPNTPMPERTDGTEAPSEVETGEPTESPVYLPASYYSTTDEIMPETEMELFNLEEDELEQYNKRFINRTTADMDGDGNIETVELLPGKLGEGIKAEDEYKSYNTLVVKIGSKKITVRSTKYRDFEESTDEDGTKGPWGYLIDLDKNDGRKEIILEDNFEDWPECCIITYDGKTIRQMPWLQSTVAADGTGYVTVSEAVEDRKLACKEQGMVIERIKKYLPDKGKLVNIKVNYYRTWYSVFPPVSEDADPSFSAWDQNLAAKPDAEENIFVKKSTEIYYGWYHNAGWLEVHTRDGKTLGWLNIKKVDWMEYTRWANDPFQGW